MSAAVSLPAVTRTSIKKQVNALRAAGKIPAVIYGYRVENQSIELDAHSALPILRSAGGTTIIKLNIDESRAVSVLLHDVQRDSKNRVTHLDFLAVNLREKMQVMVPVVVTGEAPAVIDEGGTLVIAKNELEVECLPTNIPHEITIDVSGLATFDQSIYVKDIPAIEDVVILADPEDVVISITEPISEEELAELEAPVGETEVAEVVDGDGEPTAEGGAEASTEKED